MFFSLSEIKRGLEHEAFPVEHWVLKILSAIKVRLFLRNLWLAGVPFAGVAQRSVALILHKHVGLRSWFAAGSDRLGVLGNASPVARLSVPEIGLRLLGVW